MADRICQKYGLEVWAYCLITNHIHLIAFPHHQASLARSLAATPTRYSQSINRRTRKGGHLWQGRFFSCPLNDEYLIRAARYIELNPVRAGLVAEPADWPRSSTRAHFYGGEDRLQKKWGQTLFYLSIVSPLDMVLPLWAIKPG